MSSGSKKKEPRYTFSFSLKSSSKRTPSRFPTGPLWRELPAYKAFFYISLKLLIKISLNKGMFPSLKGLRKGPCEKGKFPYLGKRGPCGNRRPLPEPYLAYPSGSLVKEPSLQVPLIELHWREMPHP
jgi:hypothetical protein